MNERDIFIAALQKGDCAERSAFLEEACGSNAGLRQQVDALFREHEQLGRFLEAPALVLASTIADPRQEWLGTTIGSYKLLEQIGEGGFGLVFMAEQQQPVRRKVAVKVLKPGMDTHQVIARFEAERQALAIMDHPNIARVLDAGATGGATAGRPYVVMELVRGVPITSFCDENRLPPRERLELFATVCHAVQHAHHKGIILRVIKPSNVMVTLHDGAAVVKVIDFGIAKALGQQLTDKTLFTGFAQMLGTPLYMSPEQAGGGPDIDTRTDIYSLGVLLYELLTGMTPFHKDRLQEAGYDEMRRIIREEEPAKPSTRVSTLGQVATIVSAQRNSDPKRLSQLFRGDLDWIVMKALEKDRNRRYETASAFAADVHRYLHDEPVAACPPSAWYRCRKFARRNRRAITLAAVVTAAFVLVGGSIGWVARDRAARERTQAEREAALDCEESRTLDDAEALIGDGKWPEALLAVQRGEKLLAAAGRRELPPRHHELLKDLSMAQRLEDIYNHGNSENPKTGHDQDVEYAEAVREYGIDVVVLPVAEAAQRIRARSIRLELARALDFWSQVRWGSGKLGAPPWKQLLEVAKAADPDPWRNQLRNALAGSDRKALEALAASADIRRLPPASLHFLGNALCNVVGREQAVAFLRQAQRQYPEDFWLNDALGRYCMGFGKRGWGWDDALRFSTAALAARPRNPELTLRIGSLLQLKGSLPEAIAQFSKAIDLQPDYVDAWCRRTIAYLDLGQLDAALADYAKAIELEPFGAKLIIGFQLLSKQIPWNKAIADLSKAIASHPERAVSWHLRALVYELDGQWAKAVADHTQAIERDPQAAQTWHSWFNRAMDYKHLQQWDKAIADFSRALEREPATTLYGAPTKTAPWWIYAWSERGLSYAKVDQWDKAIADYSRTLGPTPENGGVLMRRAQAYAVLGQWDKAAADTDQALVVDANDSERWLELACYRLQAGDTGGYQKARAAMLERFGTTKDAVIAHRIALSCLLIPEAARDQTLQLAELGATGAPQNLWCLITRGAALYRAGQFEPAANQLRLVLKKWPEDPYARPGTDGAPILAWLFLGMADHRLGHARQARLWLKKAVQTMDQESSQKKIGPLRQQSHVWAMCLVVRREVEQLLKAPAKGPPKEKEPKRSTSKAPSH